MFVVVVFVAVVFAVVVLKVVSVVVVFAVVVLNIVVFVVVVFNVVVVFVVVVLNVVVFVCGVIIVVVFVVVFVVVMFDVSPDTTVYTVVCPSSSWSNVSVVWPQSAFGVCVTDKQVSSIGPALSWSRSRQKLTAGFQYVLMLLAEFSVMGTSNTRKLSALQGSYGGHLVSVSFSLKYIGALKMIDNIIKLQPGEQVNVFAGSLLVLLFRLAFPREL